jgi:hypothetical protein
MSGRVGSLASLYSALGARVPTGIGRGEMLTYEEQELNRQERLNEVGTEPPCPLCQRPRVSRTDYIRCNRCGINWLAEEMNLPDYLNLDPRVSRQRAALTGRSTPPTAEQQADHAESKVV